MDPATLATAAVALLTPYLKQIGNGVATKLGENAVNTGGKLLHFLHGKLPQRGQEALAELEANPSDPDNQAALRQALRKALEADLRFAEELKSLLPPDAINADTISQKVSGENSKAVQIKGNNNTTSIT